MVLGKMRMVMDGTLRRYAQPDLLLAGRLSSVARTQSRVMVAVGALLFLVLVEGDTRVRIANGTKTLRLRLCNFVTRTLRVARTSSPPLFVPQEPWSEPLPSEYLYFTPVNFRRPPYQEKKYVLSRTTLMSRSPGGGGGGKSSQRTRRQPSSSVHGPLVSHPAQLRPSPRSQQ
jgi:hypothetical protein